MQPMEVCVFILESLSRECAQIHLKSNITPAFLLANSLLVQNVSWMIDYESTDSFKWLDLIYKCTRVQK